MKYIFYAACARSDYGLGAAGWTSYTCHFLGLCVRPTHCRADGNTTGGILQSFGIGIVNERRSLTSDWDWIAVFLQASMWSSTACLIT